ncbi:MAG TPA: anthrone oxygenase family protein [Nocardioides sp.]|nr:anthrone oxygenase family protein [Nocardioides sp.]
MNEILDSLRAPSLVAAAVASGLQAGTYYTWACGVMPGLARADDRTFVATMQHVNVAIVNPVFLASFLGAPLLAGAALLTSSGSARPWVVAGLLLAIGTVAITGGGNVPLNNALEAAGPVDRIADLAAVRADFESAWVRWNVARALTSTGALAALAWAALRS